MTPGPAGKGTRTALEWYQDGLERTDARRRLPRAVVLVLVALALGGVFAGGRLLGFDPTKTSHDAVYGLFDDVPSLPPLPPPPSPSPSATDSTPSPGTDDLDVEAFRARYLAIVEQNPDVTEGVDYSFIGTVEGAPPHWTCSRDIAVVLVGTVPAGAEEALREVVDSLASASRLDMHVETAESAMPARGSIAVYYAPEGVAPASFSVEDPAVGRGGPRYFTAGAAAGVIEQGEVVIRDDVPGLEPTTNAGKQVLAHEVMHALGSGHSADGLPEVMTPRVSGQWPGLGRGDQVALQVVGCD